jgi:hypothetical protein
MDCSHSGAAEASACTQAIKIVIALRDRDELALFCSRGSPTSFHLSTGNATCVLQCLCNTERLSLSPHYI